MLAIQPSFEEITLYFGSFSKMIAPGLRVGWVLPPEWLYGHLVNASETSQLNPSVFSQQLIGAYLDNPAWQDKLAEYRGIYREKFNALVETLEEVMPPPAPPGTVPPAASTSGSRSRKELTPRPWSTSASNAVWCTFPARRSTPTGAGKANCGCPSACRPWRISARAPASSAKCSATRPPRWYPAIFQLCRLRGRRFMSSIETRADDATTPKESARYLRRSRR